jgi:hypothetical protein
MNQSQRLQLLAPFLLSVGLMALSSGCKSDPPPNPNAKPNAKQSAAATSSALPRTLVPLSQRRGCRARCKIVGLCGWDEKNKKCIARSQEDCSNCRACKHNGICTFMPGGYCGGTNDEDCSKSIDCKDRGLCALGGGGATTCAARNDKDCAPSTNCKKSGDCTAIGGFCRPDKVADCKQSDACKDDGRCSIQEPSNAKQRKRCAALSDADCKAATTCTKDKKCKAQNGACVG